MTLAERVIKYILSRRHEEFPLLSVSMLARTFGTDRYKLLREFKKEIDMTLEYYLNQERMCRCGFILLSNPDIAVKEVSKMMGFCTSDYFIQVFKKFYGIVPGQFREVRTKRSGRDRRSSDRHRNPGGKIPPNGKPRKGPKDRRKGPKDRRLSH